MKKIIVLCTALALTSGIAMAKGPHHGGFNDPNHGGFNGPNSQTQMMQQNGGFQGLSIDKSTVAEALKMGDDQRVALQGHIVQSLGGKHYLFKDDTGTINIEIDYKRWRGLVITPSDLVEIQGEVEKDWNSIEIDVKRIMKLNVTN